MKVSVHMGRTGSAKHNCRDFDIEKARDGHIDADKTKDNFAWSWNGDKDFARAELTFYKDHYAKSLEVTNAKYKAQRHLERCKTMQQIIRNRQTKPDEMILQIGAKEDTVDKETLKSCAEDFIKDVRDWNGKHGNHVHILDWALHVDETTPHIHLRQCYDYKDKDGIRHLSQRQALKQAGVSLPDPKKPEGRYNSYKMSYTRLLQEKWLEICRKHGLQLEDFDHKSHKYHLDRDKYIDKEIVAKEAKVSELQAQVDALQQASKLAEQELSMVRTERDKATEQVADLTQQRDALQTAVDRAEQGLALLKDERDQYRREASQARSEATQARSERDSARAEAAGLKQQKDALQAAVDRLEAKVAAYEHMDPSKRRMLESADEMGFLDPEPQTYRQHQHEHRGWEH